MWLVLWVDAYSLHNVGLNGELRLWMIAAILLLKRSAWRCPTQCHSIWGQQGQFSYHHSIAECLALFIWFWRLPMYLNNDPFSPHNHKHSFHNPYSSVPKTPATAVRQSTWVNQSTITIGKWRWKPWVLVTKALLIFTPMQNNWTLVYYLHYEWKRVHIAHMA